MSPCFHREARRESVDAWRIAKVESISIFTDRTVYRVELAAEDVFQNWLIFGVARWWRHHEQHFEPLVLVSENLPAIPSVTTIPPEKTRCISSPSWRILVPLER